MFSLVYILTFFLGVLISLVMTPIIIRLAPEYGIVDHPEQRKVHREPMPSCGGLAVFLGAVIPTVLVFVFFKELSIFFTPRIVRAFSAIATASAVIVVLGVIDDKYALGAKLKLGIQTITALILYIGGVSITFVKIPGYGYYYLSPAVSFIVTVLWILAIMNAMNLLDGLDGLLSGVAVISGLFLFIIAVWKAQALVAVMLIALVGACLGFLRYNFNPARIFLGDTGSLFIGLMFAATSIMGALKTTFTLAFLIPVMIMGLPIFDTAFAIIRRAISKKPIFSPDSDHVHHRLLKTGISHRNAVLVIYFIVTILGVGGLLLAVLSR